MFVCRETIDVIARCIRSITAPTLLLLSLGCDATGTPIRLPQGPQSCIGPSPLSGTLLTLPFDEFAAGTNVMGGQDVINTGSALRVTVEGGDLGAIPGPTGCGQALRVGTGGGHLVVPDAPSWDMTEGSVDFWFRPDACAASEQGVITRDAEFTMRPGHFRVFWRTDCRLSVRLQPEAIPQDTEGAEVTTTEPLPVGRWTHFAVNFGTPGLELWVDGERAGFAPTEQTLVGNDNPWTIFVSNDRSEEGAVGPVWRPLQNAALDYVRITNRRQHWEP